MANPEHLAKLKEGVEAWNTWRIENPGLTPDLSRLLFSFDVKLSEDLTNYDLSSSDLIGADLSTMILDHCDFSHAELMGVDLTFSFLDEVNFLNADTRNVDVRSYRNPKKESENVTFQDLSTCRNLSQDQLEVMLGDRFTKIPTYLTMPERWLKEPVDGIDYANEPSQDPTRNSSAITPNRQDSVAAPSQANIRAALKRDYAQPRDLAIYMVEQLQQEIAVHKTIVPPNEPEGHQRHENSGKMLAEMLVAVQSLHFVLPETTVEPNAEELETLRTRLTNMLAKVDQMIETLHSGTGYKSDFWAMGIISGVGAIATALGGTFVVGAGLTATIVGRKRVADGFANVVKLIKE